MIDLVSRTPRAIAVLIAGGVAATALPCGLASAQTDGTWNLWKGSDQAGGDKMYVDCVQNGQHVVSLSGLKYFSEYIVGDKVLRVRFKYNQDQSSDATVYHVIDVSPVAGTLCQWGMAQ